MKQMCYYIGWNLKKILFAYNARGGIDNGRSKSKRK